MNEDRPAWNDAAAAAMVGKRVIVGLTYLTHDNRFIEQVQKHGLIQSVSPVDGLLIALEGEGAGESFWLPPQLDNFQAAAPGEYRLRSTGEVIVDPDYVSTWTINRPAE